MKNYIPSLNGLRAISIFCVLFSHVQARNFGRHDAPGGQIGVNIFFIISGYLITLLLLQEESRTGAIKLKNFFIRRVVRIFPIYYVLLLFYFILQRFEILSFHPNSWILSLTYTKYFLISNGTDWESGHLWSLSVEEHFYIIWPLVFKYLKSKRIIFSFLVILFSTVTRLITDTSELSILTRADALMIGAIFAIYNEKFSSIIKEAVLRYKVVLILPFILVIACMLAKRIIGVSDNNSLKHIISAFGGSYGLITNLSIALIIIISINFRENIWYKFLNNKFLNYIGLLSYSIYIWQQLFFSPKINSISNFPINLVYIFIVANMSYFLIEKPFLKLKAKLTKPEINHVNLDIPLPHIA